jgi:hypothetical protein
VLKEKDGDSPANPLFFWFLKGHKCRGCGHVAIHFFACSLKDCVAGGKKFCAANVVVNFFAINSLRDSYRFGARLGYNYGFNPLF